MRILRWLASAAASRLDDDESAQLIRGLLASAMRKASAPMADPSEFEARSHLEHACALRKFFESLEDSCEHGSWLTAGCSTGCERFEESLRHGGCVECCRDERVPPRGLTVTPEDWDEIRPHMAYATCLADLLMTEPELLYAYGDGDDPFQNGRAA